MGGADAAAGSVLRTGGASEDTGAVDALPRGFCMRIGGAWHQLLIALEHQQLLQHALVQEQGAS